MCLEFECGLRCFDLLLLDIKVQRRKIDLIYDNCYKFEMEILELSKSWTEEGGGGGGGMPQVPILVCYV